MNTVLALALLAPSQPPNVAPPPPQPGAMNPQVPLAFPGSGWCGNEFFGRPDPGFGLMVNAEVHWPLFITASPDVQKELKLTKEQLTAFETAQADLKKSVQGLPTVAAQRNTQSTKLTQWADAKLVVILNANQLKRHRQLVWQLIEGNAGIHTMTANPVFAKEIGLTTDQKKRATQIHAEYNAALLKQARIVPKGSTSLVDAEAELTKKHSESALKLLTAEQKKKWNEALGEPFKGEVKQPPTAGLRPLTFKSIAEKK